jgi:hypothetical protein
VYSQHGEAAKKSKPFYRPPPHRAVSRRNAPIDLPLWAFPTFSCVDLLRRSALLQRVSISYLLRLTVCWRQLPGAHEHSGRACRLSKDGARICLHARGTRKPIRLRIVSRGHMMPTATSQQHLRRETLMSDQAAFLAKSSPIWILRTN